METPLSAWHQKNGAKMTQFGGYHMPLEYQGILQEHRLVRESVGMFDVSHMGEFRVEGASAVEFLDRLVTNPPSRLEPGQALYTCMCAPDGGTVDDLVVYRLNQNTFLLVVNAANRDTDYAWMVSQLPAGGNVRLADLSETLALISVQGPQAASALEPWLGALTASLRPFHFVQGIPVAKGLATVSRTGYTGEDGFELYVDAEDAPNVWETLYAASIPPIGLGARDTLRLEARLPLYGHELSRTISPLNAGLGRFVRFDENDFIGRAALERERSNGPSFQIVGMQVKGSGMARSGFAVGCGTRTVGMVTSGSYSPTLKSAIALALVPKEFSHVGMELWILIRGRRVAAEVVKTPFYRRPGRRHDSLKP